ncbi:MAG: diacylglycerol kinase family protein [Anaerolineales bacterium]|nr:diacylglycerol kinase family lipid kinase [Anaerolineales bacterium]
MTAKVILNPYAGRWQGQARKEELEASLREVGVDFDLEVTDGPGHAIDLAQQAVEHGFNPVIAAGGDGTYNEVVNGIAAANNNDGSIIFGVLPLGSANDLVDNLKLPKDLPSAARVIADGQFRMMDLCKVNDRYFDNNAAIGLEPYITLIQQRITRLKGSFRYLTATLLGVIDKPQWDMDLEWDGGHYSGPVTLVTVGNSPRTGGIFFMTPHADPFDGLLTFVHGYMPTRRKILSLLPRTMKPDEGSYVEHPSIHEISSPWLKVRSVQPTPAHADGVIFSENIHDLEYRVIPQSLPILMPNN